MLPFGISLSFFHFCFVLKVTEPMEGGRRVLGIQRQVEDIVTTTSDANTEYHVGDETTVLLDEVLNNSTRAVLVYDDFSGRFTDFEMYQLSVVFRHNRTIVAITLSGVDVGDEGVTLLCQALVRSNVQYIDLTNTPLDDEAGSSLAALARCNRNLRTVIVTDTLISEEILDEIDLACQINESSGDPDPVPPVEQGDVKYCVSHLFDACPNGAYCLYSHNLPGTAVDLKQLEADWEKALPPPPQEGATWREDAESPKKLRIDLSKVRRQQQQRSAGGPPESAPGAVPPRKGKSGRKRGRTAKKDLWIATGVLLLATAAVAVAVIVSRRSAR